MPISFPHQPEIQLDRPPLEEVVCQVRFPPILRIGKEDPVDFQDLIRRRFPQLRFEQPVKLSFPKPGNEAAPSADFEPRLFRFLSSEGEKSVSLTVNFFALTTQAYRHWRQFADDLQFVNDAAQQVYEPSFATRIGLRYINRLSLSNTGTQNREELFSLLKNELTAMLTGSVWSDADNMTCRLSFSEQDAKLNFRIAYEVVDDAPNFLLDFDYFEEGNLPLDDLVERSERYHSAIYDAFRWCLTEDSLERFRN